MEDRKFWKDWRFKGKYLFDPDGNRYHQDEIRSIFYQRQLHKELTGTTLRISSLKQELERRIKAAQMPEVIVKFGDGSEQRLIYKGRF